MEKLAELGNTREWVQWLKAASDAEDAHLLGWAQAELDRSVADGDLERPKWKMRIRLHTSTHLIKPKALNYWNSSNVPTRLLLVHRKPGQLLVEFDMPKSLLYTDLYPVGLSISYRFITALNIGTAGFFWFDLPTHLRSFHDRLEDVESGTLVGVERREPILIPRQTESLTEADMRAVALVFRLLPHHPSRLVPYQHYLKGLMYWAKTDIHSGFHVNSFLSFFGAFQAALTMYGDWDSAVPFRDAAIAALIPLIRGGATEAVNDFTNLAESCVPDEIAPEVTLEQAAVMKLFVDVYFQAVLEREGLRNIEKIKSAQNAGP
jgi:hypothetical protein